MGVRLMTEGAQEAISAQIDALTNAISGGEGASAGNYDSKNLPSEDSGRATANSIANLTAATKTKLSDLVTLSGAQTISGQKTFACVIVGNIVGDLSGTANVAERLSTSAGANNQPIYFSGGKPAAIAETFGDSSTPIYLSKGIITNCSQLATLSAMNNSFNGISVSDATITMTRYNNGTTSIEVNNVGHSTNAAKLDTSAGNSVWPVYFSGGLPTKISSITANVATNATQLSSSAGNAIQPVYFSDGKPVAVSNIAAGGYVRLGGSASANSTSAIAIGPSANAYSNSTVAIGYNAKANTVNGIAIGTNSVASGLNAIAIGNGAKANYSGQVVIGNLSFPTKSFGNATSWSDLAANSSTASRTMTANDDGWFVAYFHSMKSGGSYGYISDSSINSTFYRARHDADAGYWGEDGQILWLPVRSGDSVYMYVKYGYFSDIYNVKGTRSV